MSASSIRIEAATNDLTIQDDGETSGLMTDRRGAAKRI